MFKRFLEILQRNSNTAVLTAAVLGALYLQLNLLSGQLELQKQQFERQVGETSKELNSRVSLHLKRKSMGFKRNRFQGDSTLVVNTPMGRTQLSWSSNSAGNFGMADTSLINGFFENFQSTLPWSAQLSISELEEH